MSQENQLSIAKSRIIQHQYPIVSSSKAKYTFPKQSRFPKQQQINCPVAFYDQPTTKTLRSASIGLGKKSYFTESDQQVPGPATYTLLGDFEKLKGVTIPKGREDCSFGSPLKRSITPGPGTYQPENSYKNLTFKNGYSIAKKTVDFRTLTTAQYNPGPGTYNIKGLEKSGQYFNSKFSAIKRCVFPPPTLKRFPDFTKFLTKPGPGEYDKISDKMSQQFLWSKIKNVVSCKFPKEERNTLPRQSLKTPGPGTYRQLSEFGEPPQFIKKITSTSSSRLYTEQKRSSSTPHLNLKQYTSNDQQQLILQQILLFQ